MGPWPATFSANLPWEVRVGAISGAIASVPFLLVLGLGVAVFFGTAPAGGFGAPGGVELAVILLFIVPLGVLWNAGLGAGGGYVGAYIRAHAGSAESTMSEPGHEAR